MGKAQRVLERTSNKQIRLAHIKRINRIERKQYEILVAYSGSMRRILAEKDAWKTRGEAAGIMETTQ